jgi:signal transduction histidine kinase
VRLADFILGNIEPILTEWEAFAATHLPAAATMDTAALRDHAPEILQAIVLDLRTPQSLFRQDQKAKGNAPVLRDASKAAQMHALLRAQGGFSVVQMAAEYRALRASVLRLWTDASHRAPTDLLLAMEDVQRFNEAIDQALMESVAFFSQEVERARNLFLAIVGHDLRNPLDTIQITANYLSKVRVEGATAEAVGRILRSSARIRTLLDDLLDYNRAALGKSISVSIAEVDLAEMCATEVDALRSAHDARLIRFHASGDLRGTWDAARIQQLLSNLVQNALDYGAPSEAVEVRATGKEHEVMLSVHNRGPAIPPETMARIFEPLTRGDLDHERTNSNRHLGLGLFISRQIARAHGGDIQVRSDEYETVFSVRLPRRKG